MKKLNLNEKYVVNPAYKMRSDKNRVIVTNNDSYLCDTKGDRVPDVNITNSFSWIMHPEMAYIFSFFNGENTLDEILTSFEDMTQTPKEDLLESILPFIENTEDVLVPIKFVGAKAVPKQFLIKRDGQIKPRFDLLKAINIEEILQNLDLKSLRFYIPNQMSLMLNNVCVTDCEYCYANKSHKVEKSLSFERVKELIAEANSLGMRDFEVGGGEFFLYPHWKELIQELHKYNYNPYISTKHPIDIGIVKALKENNINRIQLSIDTVDNEEIKKMLHVSDSYLDKVKKGVSLLNDAGIEITVKPVITKYNDSIKSVTNLIDFLAQYEMVKFINIAPGSYSIYKPFTFASTVENIKVITDLVDSFSEKYGITINMQGYDEDRSAESKVEGFKDRGLCSGNMTSFYVLPDGKVTICEQMYWHPFFIMGDLSNQSILEMWNSEKALSLWNFNKTEVRDESPCKTCEEFDKCRRGKGNCWRLAISAYGEDNYDYPAPNCPLAPPITRPYFLSLT